MVFTWIVNPHEPSVYYCERVTFSPALIPRSKWVPYWGCLKFHCWVHYLIPLSLIPLMLLRLPALSPPTGEHLACYLTLLNHVTVWRDHCGRGFHAHTLYYLLPGYTSFLLKWAWKKKQKRTCDLAMLHFLWFWDKLLFKCNQESCRVGKYECVSNWWFDERVQKLSIVFRCPCGNSVSSESTPLVCFLTVAPCWAAQVSVPAAVVHMMLLHSSDFIKGC